MNFREFEELANSGTKEIVLTEDVILEDDEEEKYKKGIKIIDDLIIDGNNHVFDAKGKTRIFLLNSQCIKIINCVFKGYDDCAIKNLGRLEIQNLEFINNSTVHVAIRNTKYIGIESYKFDAQKLFKKSAIKVLASEKGKYENLIEGGMVFITFDRMPKGYKSFGDLDNLILSGQNEIILDADFIFTDDDEALSKLKNRDLLIDGNGHVIDANGKRGIFDIESSKIKFKNVTFKNGYSENGGAVNSSGSDLTFEKCDFDGNLGYGKGGAIFTSEGSLSLNNTSFKNNISKQGGGVYSQKGNMNICNSIFKNNQSSTNEFHHGGGVIFNCEGNLNIMDSNFCENLGCNGAVIANLFKSSLKVVNSKFNENKVSHQAGKGVIYNEGFMNLRNCQLNGNLLEDNDYGVIFNNYAYGTIIDCEIKNNRFEYLGYDYSKGFTGVTNIKGALFLTNCILDTHDDIFNCQGLMNLKNCIFPIEFAYPCLRNMGLLHFESYNSLFDENYEENDFIMNDGFIIIDSDEKDDLILVMNEDQSKNSEYDYNIVHNEFNYWSCIDADYSFDKRKLIHYNNFEELYSDYKFEGKLLDLNNNDSLELSPNCNDGTYLKDLIDINRKEIILDSDIVFNENDDEHIIIDVDDLTIDGNNHIIEANNGSIFKITAKNVLLKNMIFKNSSPKWMDSLTDNLNNCNSNFENKKDYKNYIDSKIKEIFNGGVLYLENASIKLENCLFINNRGGDGAAIYGTDSSLSLEKCKFSNNFAHKSLINLDKSEIYFKDCVFNNNVLGRNLIYTDVTSFESELFFKFENCEFLKNSCHYFIGCGSTINDNNFLNVLFLNCTFDSNLYGVFVWNSETLPFTRDEHIYVPLSTNTCFIKSNFRNNLMLHNGRFVGESYFLLNNNYYAKDNILGDNYLINSIWSKNGFIYNGKLRMELGGFSSNPDELNHANNSKDDDKKDEDNDYTGLGALFG